MVWFSGIPRSVISNRISVKAAMSVDSYGTNGMDSIGISASARSMTPTTC